MRPDAKRFTNRKSPPDLKGGTVEYARWWKANNRDRHLQHKRNRAARKKVEQQAIWDLVGGKPPTRKTITAHAEKVREIARQAHAVGISFTEAARKAKVPYSTVANAARFLGLRSASVKRRGRRQFGNQLQFLIRAQATPKWADHDAILAIYAEARQRRAAGEPVEVDHIVPIRGKAVCGLHVHWNLQIITKEENARKKNNLLD
jgi:hypothetical protein